MSGQVASRRALDSDRQRIDIWILQHVVRVPPRRHRDHRPANVDGRRHVFRQQPFQTG